MAFKGKEGLVDPEVAVNPMGRDGIDRMGFDVPSSEVPFAVYAGA